MRIKIIVEECDFPPTEALVNTLHNAFLRRNPAGLNIRIDDQPIPQGTNSALIERIRCVVRQTVALMDADTSLDWGVYVSVAPTMFVDPISGSTAFSRNALIVGVRNRKGTEWCMLEVVRGGELPERAQSQVLETHQKVIRERGMDQQQVAYEEILVAEALMGRIRGSIIPLLELPRAGPGAN